MSRKTCPQECPRYNEELDHPHIKGVGPVPCTVMFIGENPGKHEDRKGKPFVGRSGKLLDKILDSLEWSRKDIYITNVVKCFTNKDDPKPTAKDIRCCKPYLVKEIKKVKPNVICALGATALKATLNRTGIKKLKNNIFWSEEFGCKVVPTFHPAWVLRNLEQKQFLVDGIELALSEANKKDVVYKSKIKTQHLIADTPEKVDRTLEKLESVPAFSFDFETTNLHYLSCKILSIGVSWKPGIGVSIPWRLVAGDRLERLKKILVSDKVKIAQNIKFDLQVAKANNIRVKPPIEDTMLMHHLINENMKHDLDTLVLAYTDMGEYWADLNAKKKEICKEKKISEDGFTYDLFPEEVLNKYGAGDADATFRLGRKFGKELEKQGLEEFYRTHTLPMLPVIVEMEYKGIAIDRSKLRELVDAYTAKVLIAEKEFTTHPDVVAYEKYREQQEMEKYYATYTESTDKLRKKYRTSKNLQSRFPDNEEQYVEYRYPGGKEKYAADKLKKASERQLRERYKKMKMLKYAYPEGEDQYIQATLDRNWIFNSKSPQQLQELLFDHAGLKPIKETKTGYSTDEEVMNALADQGVGIAKKIVDYRKLVKYTSTYIVSVYEKSAYDGRIHTNFLQIGTVTGRLSSKEPNLQNIPRDAKDFKSCFVADPGYTFVKADLAQAEFRCWAHYSGDEDLIADIEAGLDIHTRTASEVFGILESEVTKDQRTAAKNAVFGLLYGRGSKAISEQYGISIEQADEIKETFFSRYPVAKQWLDNIVKHCKAYGYVRSWFGRVRRLPSIYSDNQGEQAEAEREAKNSPIQAQASDMNNGYFVESLKRARKQGIKCFPCMTVHDANFFQVKKEQKDALICIMKDVVATKYPDFKCEMKLDFEVGDTLGTLEEIEG